MLDVDGVALGKPGSAPAAVSRWHDLRGGVGTLWTGHCLREAHSGRSWVHSAQTQVYFADVSDTEIERYAATGEPSAVAGAFTLDGLGGWFVEEISGDHGNVLGLSLPLLRRLFARLGVSVADLWSAG
jgi:septum formation protein